MTQSCTHKAHIAPFSSYEAGPRMLCSRWTRNIVGVDTNSAILDPASSIHGLMIGSFRVHRAVIVALGPGSITLGSLADELVD